MSAFAVRYLHYLDDAPGMGLLDAFYCSLGTMATVRAGLESYLPRGYDTDTWHATAMLQEVVDIVFISGVVAFGIAKFAELQNRGR